MDWSSTRRRRIENVLEGITGVYVKEHGRLTDERARHGLGWWAAQDTRPDKKAPRSLKQLLAWWRAPALLKFGKRMVDGLLQHCRAHPPHRRAAGARAAPHRVRTITPMMAPRAHHDARHRSGSGRHPCGSGLHWASANLKSQVNMACTSSL
ncbi:relaxase domain-containing protein [Streptomyces sp. NPDC002669]|uniref:relaxase domain-containing protein n=1 Tax=Streptomyces sp. NPDC002669 TaxID=3364658 RepID=UPI0036774D91